MTRQHNLETLEGPTKKPLALAWGSFFALEGNRSRRDFFRAIGAYNAKFRI